MADIVQEQSGDFSNPATWVGGSVPVAGDRIVRTTPNLMLYIDADTPILGPDAAENDFAIQGNDAASDTGEVVVRAGVTLNVSGSVRAGGRDSNIRLEAGARVIQHAVTNNHHMAGGRPVNYNSGAIITEGTVDNWCEIENVGGGAFVLSQPAGNNIEIYEGTYCRLKNIAGTRYGRDMVVNHWIWDENCGPVYKFGDNSNSYDYSFTSCSHLNPSTYFSVECSSETTATGLRVFKDNVIKANLRASSDIFYDGVILGTTGTGGSGSGDKGRWENCFMMSGVTTPKVRYYKNMFYHWPESAYPDNPHVISAQLHSGESSILIERCVIGYGGSAMNGDLIFCPNAPTTVRYCLALPNAIGRSSGVFISCQGGDDSALTAYNNSFFEGPGIRVGESYNFATNTNPMVLAYVNNMEVSGLSSGAQTIEYPDFAPNSAAAFNVVDHNSSHGSAQVYATNSNLYQNTPGPNDLNIDPKIFELRKLGTWAADVLGSTGATLLDRENDAIAALFARNDPSDPNYHPDATVANLLAYVLEGYTPQELAYSSAGAGGAYHTYMGAVEPAIVDIQDTIAGGTFELSGQGLVSTLSSVLFGSEFELSGGAPSVAIAASLAGVECSLSGGEILSSLSSLLGGVELELTGGSIETEIQTPTGERLSLNYPRTWDPSALTALTLSVSDKDGDPIGSTIANVWPGTTLEYDAHRYADRIRLVSVMPSVGDIIRISGVNGYEDHAVKGVNGATRTVLLEQHIDRDFESGATVDRLNAYARFDFSEIGAGDTVILTWTPTGTGAPFTVLKTIEDYDQINLADFTTDLKALYSRAYDALTSPANDLDAIIRMAQDELRLDLSSRLLDISRIKDQRLISPPLMAKVAEMWARDGDERTEDEHERYSRIYSATLESLCKLPIWVDADGDGKQDDGEVDTYPEIFEKVW